MVRFERSLSPQQAMSPEAIREHLRSRAYGVSLLLKHERSTGNALYDDMVSEYGRLLSRSVEGEQRLKVMREQFAKLQSEVERCKAATIGLQNVVINKMPEDAADAIEALEEEIEAEDSEEMAQVSQPEPPDPED